MKKMQILALVVIAAAIGVLITQASDYQSYGDFSVAMEEMDRNHQIVGQLVVDDARPIVYNPEEDANAFSFYMEDEQGTIKKVVAQMAKPQDFERSEQIVLTGRMQGSDFIAHDMQLKCPSKYQDQALQSQKARQVVSK
ncbi:cytochrome c maturation protein CcmE [Saprospira sp. CCB-QB6]|uniref:cytochrome c maturation protein CcmE domain-containing protein n=1 Tax=Saprospira sp. CCB-QB6 TaxID=3023936 RepID=UPI002349158E|nr:cytochrome c maturation protein CcmE [Saprospira sp. CCB-QB6]WCL82844.1 cytochrome c maturation protein CcmE [Saprospira sp. CCB-QB6]